MSTLILSLSFWKMVDALIAFSLLYEKREPAGRVWNVFWAVLLPAFPQSPWLHAVHLSFSGEPILTRRPEQTFILLGHPHL